MPLRILIVEDEYIVAMALEDCLENIGHEVVGIAGTLSEAERLAATERPDLAFVDINLKDGRTGIDLSRSLSGIHHVVTVFLTADRALIPTDFASAVGAMGKPYADTDIERALEFIECCLARKLAEAQRPRALEVAPAFRERWQVSA